MNQQDPSTSLNDINERQTSKGSEDTKFRLAQSVISHALKKSEEQNFVFKNQVRFHTVKGHILPSVCHHKDNFKCLVCKYEKGLKLPNLPEMIFADNVLELYVPANTVQPLIQFNPYDALELVDPNTLPTFVVGSSETWQKARSNSLPKIPFPFDWSYTSYYAGTLNQNTRVEITDQIIDLEKLMRRDPIVFYDSLVLYGDDLGDNGDVEISVKVRVMTNNYFVLSRFYLRVDGVIVRVFDCRLYSEEGWNYLLRECIKREALFKDIDSEHQKFINDSTKIWQFLPIIEQKTEKIYYS